MFKNYKIQNKLKKKKLGFLFWILKG